MGVCVTLADSSTDEMSIAELRAQLAQAQQALQASEARFHNVIAKSPVGTLVVGTDGVVRFVNAAAEALLNRHAADLVNVPFGFPLVAGQTAELDLVSPDGHAAVVDMRVTENEWEGEPVYLVTMCDVTRRAQMEQALRETLHTVEQREKEVSALLKSARAVLQYQDFEPAARAIFEACKAVTGATGGYVALLTADGERNEVLFLDSGGLPCLADPELPMPLRGLRERAYRTRQAVYHNDFMHSEWVHLMPEGHVIMRNVLFVPLVIDGRAVGLIGLANKDGDFTDADAQMAMAFGEIAAVALRNSRTLEALERSQQKFQNIIAQSHDGIAVTDEEGKLIEWNRAMEQITGLRAAEVLGVPIWDVQFRLISPEQRTQDRYEQIRAAFQSLLASGEAPWLGRLQEWEHQLPDGSHRITESVVFPIWTDHQVMLGTVIRDVTARKQTEEQLKAALQEKETLLREIHHRVKGNLTIISSLLDLQSENIPDERAREMLLEAQNRIYTMARLHEHLYRSTNLGRVNMADYIRTLVGYLCQTYGNPAITMDIEIGSVTLDVDTAIPCGLIVNELVSNALKYAFPTTDGPAGPARNAIHVSLRQAEDGKLLLEIWDNGIGLPDDVPLTGKPGSLGLKLVHMLTRQLRGTLEVERTTPGTMFRIRFSPAPLHGAT